MVDRNRFEDAREKAAQEERRQIRDRNREKDRLRKISTRRQIIIGGIVIKHFPASMELQPQLNKADTAIAFAGMNEFFSAVAGDPKFSALFQELVGEKSNGGNSQEHRSYVMANKKCAPTHPARKG